MLTAIATGLDHVECDGMSAKDLTRLARKLIDAGHDQCELIIQRRNGTLCFGSATLRFWASKTITRGNTGSEKMVGYKPDPRFQEANQ